jgi:hypothetical protein
MTKTVSIQLKESSEPIVHEHVKNTYQKGRFYCVYCDVEQVYKYPIANIWRVLEVYGTHQGLEQVYCSNWSKGVVGDDND